MRIIKLDAIDSTNQYLRQLNLEYKLQDNTVVVVKNQTKGKGQMGSAWLSEPGKNLMFSMFKQLELPVRDNFYISMVVSLAVVKALQSVGIPELAIKWPNDILSCDKKVCGILIENGLKGQHIKSSIIGIGLNVNQENFKELPKASSLKSLTKKTYVIDELLNIILKQLEVYFSKLEANQLDALKQDYERLLFKKDVMAEFKNEEGAVFYGIIKSVSTSGKLQVLPKGETDIKAFDLKQLVLKY
ncbi:biotin--[acetyl-CoA-carboxylase] ligase [Mangrovimonas spongiae]|uniref:Biotin--[acetyl-CoA-carboxylase] ligase n=1 Tax=Mangrovimonas spongiae TaxID=2494697 RepID=A0A3R9PKX8_9FLAO|nr:biotin--[acetyl-CoA-carboxylase] ligase [Mangrovimonas spongiae]RSK40625.1 biotin--[acetyl-CoA-carboxylase] ligase [Mangrovimonas spongiae]